MTEIKRKASIYQGDSMIALVAEMKDHGDNSGKLSRVLNGICDSYLAIVRNYVPTLAENEWMAIIDVMNGHMSINAVQTASTLHWNLCDAVEMEGLDNKWGISSDFGINIKNMEIINKMAICHVAQVFWTLKAEENEEYNSLLLRAGAKIS